MRAPYKAKTITGAQQRVRLLERRLDFAHKLLERYARERMLLARLASKTPQFSNPLEVLDAEKLRDNILARRA